MKDYLLELAHCAGGDWKVVRRETVRRALFWGRGATVHVVEWLLLSGLEAVVPAASGAAPVPEAEICKKIKANYFDNAEKVCLEKQFWTFSDFHYPLSIISLFISLVCLNWSSRLFGKEQNLIFSHSSSFFDASAPFWVMASSLPDFREFDLTT